MSKQKGVYAMDQKIKRNVIVGQAGGPTASINSSLAGVYHAARNLGYKRIYGMLHGIQGLLENRYIDLADHLKTGLDLELLERTPSTYLGSCRYTLPEISEDKDLYDRIFATLDEMEIDVFVYIGGNDSMDTIRKLSDYAIITGSKIRFVGSPKTIDNDIMHTDHAPGFGSAAKYIATSVKEVIRDGWCLEISKGKVIVIEIMGRDAGWLTGSAALARGEDCEGPDAIYLPEVPFSVDAFLAKCKERLIHKNCVVICVSEGIRTEDGKYVSELANPDSFTDAQGYRQLTGTARYLSGIAAKEIGCKARAVEFSTLQRSAAHCASRTDIEEAFECGAASVKAADDGDSGVVSVMIRTSDDPYKITTEIKDVHKIANEVRLVPREWINETGDYVKDEFIRYVRPLIQGHLDPITVDGLPSHLYVPGFHDLL